jgi:bifunctional UDP-N-acetylglucosamine pyrophosphorylase/glucosamine-1-phosphate N-acetyltransferase
VNTLTDLAEINAVLAERQMRKLQLSGVIFDQPSTCIIDANVSIEPGVRVGPQVQLRGTTTIGRNVVIEGSSLILNSTIHPGTQIRLASRIEDSVIGEESTVGPFAHIRPGTNLGAHCRIGNFVETKNATLADGAKASHLTYLGDCTIGTDSNIGAGTITCNYDGYSKSTTTIGKGVFIGSNSSLVAPVEIGDGALVAAGSTITKNVPADAIAVGRAEQVNKPDRARARRETLEKRRGKQ